MSTSIVLDNKLDIFNLSSIESNLEPLLNESAVHIDLSKIERCDYIGIQLLISFIKTMYKNDRSVFIDNPSSVFKGSISTLGLDDEFNFMDKHHG